jgi:pimeloyl-ACP methyl ester carboxylesterase
LRIPRFSIVGLSLGGMWGAELALAAPERVRGIALLSTYIGTEAENARRRYLAMLDSIEATGTLPEIVRNEVLRMSFSPYVATSSPHLVWKLRSRLDRWNSDRLLDSVVPLGRMIFERPSTLDDLSLLSVPKLVIHGTQDLPRPIFDGRRTAEVLNCPLIELPGIGHISSLEAPEAVTKHLMNFLDRVHPVE